MPQIQPHRILLLCCLVAELIHGSFATATDVSISDGTPEIFFIDTLAPTYLWEILADDSSFDINDNAAGSNPFRILPGAPTLSLVVDSSGRIGMGTGSPAANLHIATTDTFATLRLQSTSLSPYTWQLEGSDNGFFLVDVITGAFPLSVESNAPDNALRVNSLGNVGFGTFTPTAPIHVRKAAQSGIAETIAKFEVSDDSVGKLEISNVSAGNGIFHPRLRGTTASQAVALTMEGLITTDAGLNPVVAYDAALRAGGAVVTRPLVIYRNNGTPKVTVAANGNVTATSFITASSRSLKDKIRDLDSEKASAALRQLTPVEFVYKDDANAEPRVGFIAEDVPDLVAEPDRASVPVMDVVALLTRVVKDQQQTIDEQKRQQQKTNEQQQNTIIELMRRLDALEKR